VPKVLKWATEDVDNPDCRDRGYMYWRLLSTDPAAARDIVLAEKPPISTETDRMDRTLLDQLLLHGASLSSIFHRQPQTFIRGAKARYMPDSPVRAPSPMFLFTCSHLTQALDEAARRNASNHIYSKPAPRASAGIVAVQPAPAPALPARSVGGAAAVPSSPVADASAELRAADDDDLLSSSPPAAGAARLQRSDEADGDDTAEELARRRRAPTDDDGGADPYAMLGDDFGFAGSYATDAPAPKSSGIDELLA
jgi:hypothetical protein